MWFDQLFNIKHQNFHLFQKVFILHHVKLIQKNDKVK